MQNKNLNNQNPTQLDNIGNSDSNLSDIVTNIIKQRMQAEESVIKEVLRQLLKREPTLEDAKNLHIYQKQGEFNKYRLDYKNLKLGTIYRNTNFIDGKIEIEFIPFKAEDLIS